MLDTGCLAGDFVATRIVERYNIQPFLQSTAKLSVRSGLDNTYYDMSKSVIISVNFFNDTATTEIYTIANTLSLHDALPIWKNSGHNCTFILPIFLNERLLGRIC